MIFSPLSYSGVSSFLGHLGNSQAAPLPPCRRSRSGRDRKFRFHIPRTNGPAENRHRAQKCEPEGPRHVRAVYSMAMRTLRALLLCSAAAFAAAPEYSGELIFPLEKWHNHSSSVVELPNGDLLVCWFHGSGERTDGAVCHGRHARFPGNQSRAVSGFQAAPVFSVAADHRAPLGKRAHEVSHLDRLSAA